MKATSDPVSTSPSRLDLTTSDGGLGTVRKRVIELIKWKEGGAKRVCQ